MAGHEPRSDTQLSQMGRQKSLGGFVKWAIVLHVIVIVVAAFGLPRWRGQEPIDLTKAVSVDLVAATGDISSAPNKAKKQFVPNAKPKETPKPPQPPKPSEKPPAPAKSDAAKKDDVKKPDEEILDKPSAQIEKPKKLATEKAEEKIKLDKKKEKKKPVKDDNKGQQQKQEEFNSLLKNLLSDDASQPDGSVVDAPVDTKAKVEGSAPTTSDTLQLSDMDALRYQLGKCWNVPSGAMNAEDLIVDIRVEVGEDRMVKSAEIIDQARYNNDDFFRAAADSARRALYNPNCTPLQLPPDKYDVWKTIRIRFNPKDMFGG